MLMNMGDEGNDIKRVVISDEELMSINKEALVKIWMKQEKYITSLEQKHLSEVKELETKLQAALNDSQRKEDLMVMRLNAKEQELQDYMTQISEMKSSSANSAVRNLLLDPAVNFVIEKLKRELCDTKAKLEETQSELSAWKFTPDSQTGKRLMAKCRLLHEENEELGKVVASGKLARLETELALQRNLIAEMKKAESEKDGFVQELDEELEGMQSTIHYLQQQLREAKAQATAAPPSANGHSAGQPPAAAATVDTSELNGHAEPEPDGAQPESPQPEPEPERDAEPEPAEREPETVSEPACDPEPRAAATAGTPPEPAAPPDKPEPPAAAEPEPADRTSPEPTGRRRRRRAEQPEAGASPEPGRTKRRAAAGAAEDSPSRRAKRTRSSDDGGVPAAAAD